MTEAEFSDVTVQGAFLDVMADAGGVERSACQIFSFFAVRRSLGFSAARDSIPTNGPAGRKLLQTSVAVNTVISYTSETALASGQMGVQSNTISNLEAGGFRPSNTSLRVSIVTAPTTAPMVVRTTTPPKSDSSVPTGAIIGAAVGGGLGLCLCIMGAALFCASRTLFSRRSQPHTKLVEADTQDTSMGEEDESEAVPPALFAHGQDRKGAAGALTISTAPGDVQFMEEGNSTTPSKDVSDAAVVQGGMLAALRNIEASLVMMDPLDLCKVSDERDQRQVS